MSLRCRLGFHVWRHAGFVGKNTLGILEGEKVYVCERCHRKDVRVRESRKKVPV